VHAPYGGSDVGGEITGEKHDDVGDLLRFAKPPKWKLAELHLVIHSLARRHAVNRAEGISESAGTRPEWSPYRPWRNRIDSNLRRLGACEALGHGNQCRLECAIIGRRCFRLSSEI